MVNSPYEPFVEPLEFLMRVSDPAALDRCLGTGRAELARILPTLARWRSGQRMTPRPNAVDSTARWSSF